MYKQNCLFNGGLQLAACVGSVHNSQTNKGNLAKKIRTFTSSDYIQSLVTLLFAAMAHMSHFRPVIGQPLALLSPDWRIFPLLPSFHRMLEELEPGLRLCENKHLYPYLIRQNHFWPMRLARFHFFTNETRPGLKYAFLPSFLSDGWTAVVCVQLIQPNINKPWA